MTTCLRRPLAYSFISPTRYCGERPARLGMPGLLGYAALAMTGRAGDDLVARVILEGLDGGAQIARVLAGEVRNQIRHAARRLAVASYAECSRRLSGGGIANGRALSLRRSLLGIKARKTFDLRVVDTRHQRRHHAALALAAGIGLQRRHQILRAQAGKVGHSRLGGDATLAMAFGAGDHLLARVALVGLDRRAQIACVLAGKAWNCIRQAARQSRHGTPRRVQLRSCPRQDCRQPGFGPAPDSAGHSRAPSR